MKKVLTCTICPNGCGLEIRQLSFNHYSLRGNRCPKGKNFARFRLPADSTLEEKLSHPTYSQEELKVVLSQWPGGAWEFTNASIHGSPERSRFRVLLQQKKELYLLECFPFSAAELKNRSAERCHLLKKEGFPVSTPIKGNNGEWLQKYQDGLWMLTPYIKGLTLNRRTYWKESWRGEALGAMISRLSQWNSPLKEPVFDQVHFIETLKNKIYRDQPKWLPELEPVLDYVEKKVLPLVKASPLCFNHGDPHPLNLLWGNRCILGLVDWEFAGQKPLLYDAALAMGCVGSEGPQALTGPFNRGLFKAMTQSGFFRESTLNSMTDLILASRFSWLNEWMRHQDEAMQNQEIDYMLLLC